MKFMIFIRNGSGGWSEFDFGLNQNHQKFFSIAHPFLVHRKYIK